MLDDSNISKLYKEICSLHGLKQAIESFTCITEKTSTLIEHILTNSVENISQHGVLEIAFCNRKTQKQKYHKHKFITVRSPKNYSKTLLLEKLNVLVFPDYFTYGQPIPILLTKVINDIAPFKNMCVKNNTSELMMKFVRLSKLEISFSKKSNI